MKRSYTFCHKVLIKNNELKFSCQESLLPFLSHFLKTGESILQNLSLLSSNSGSEFTSWQIDGEEWKQWQTLFSWTPKSLQVVTAAMKLKDTCSLEEKLWPN